MKSLEELIEEIKREARGEDPLEEEAPAEPVEAPQGREEPVPTVEPEAFEPYEQWEPWLLAETDPPVEPEPPLEPEPPIVEPRPPLPDEPEDDDQDGGAAGAPPPVTEGDFDIDLDVDLDFDRMLDLVQRQRPAAARARVAPVTEVPEGADQAPPAEALLEPVPENRLPPRLATVLRFALPALLLVGAAAAALALFRGPDRDPEAPGPGRTVGTSADQDVVAWSVWDGQTTEGAFVTVVAVGGDKPPIALVVPAYTIVNIPGYGDGTVGDAIAAEGPDRGAAAVENMLGVGVDASGFSTLEDLARIIDELGGIAVGERTMGGQEAVRYLMQGGDRTPISAEFQFLRWQELVVAMLDAVNGRTDVFTTLGPEVAPVLAAAGSGGAEVLEVPVVDIGAGLARPDAEEVGRIVQQRFVATARTARTVRLSVLNGVGVPGVGDRVSNVLVPAGFQLVATGNAQTFDVRETQIIATSQEFLPEAELARELLGVGKVYVGVQPSGLVDVTVVVGADFGGS